MLLYSFYTKKKLVAHKKNTYKNHPNKKKKQYCTISNSKNHNRYQYNKNFKDYNAFKNFIKEN